MKVILVRGVEERREDMGEHVFVVGASRDDAQKDAGRRLGFRRPPVSKSRSTSIARPFVSVNRATSMALA